MLVPMLAILNDDVSELGWVHLDFWLLDTCDNYTSARMGIAFTISGMSLSYNIICFPKS